LFSLQSYNYVLCQTKLDEYLRNLLFCYPAFLANSVGALHWSAKEYNLDSFVTCCWRDWIKDLQSSY
jgi:hypothetical protein